MKFGKVYFVGAGPGDPGLIAVKGVTALQEADVVVYDRLASPQLLKYAKPDARYLYCGKEPGAHSMAQDEINEILVREAMRGHIVVRLKGGDPSIFGRVGEEAQACAKRQIPFEIVPGVTSGIAAASYAGIPLTYREISSNAAFVTGHRCAGSEEKETNWQAAAGFDTLVVYMGVKNLPYIRQRLLEGGKPPATPAALVRWGTTGDQRTLTGTLDDIAAKAKEAKLEAPAILVVGEVVRLSEALGWYERKPLFGRKLLLFPSLQPARDDARLLEQWGAETAEAAILPEPSVMAERLLVEIAAYDWIIFADAWEVKLFFAALQAVRRDIRSIRARVVALDEGAEAELAARAIAVDYSLAADRSEWTGEVRPGVLGRRIGVHQGARLLMLTPEYAGINIPYTEGGAHWLLTGMYTPKVRATGYLAELLQGRGFDTLWIGDIRALYALQELANREELLGNELRRISELVCVGERTAAKAKAFGWQVSRVIRDGVFLEADAKEWLSAIPGGRVS
ncbi:uroporphyrinogen-III C-methyltransferase [Paenibacillus sp. J2TS4]|uniref:uroporphyrinogen-III C-methyltransferase n=1 Tax=Paenibacillus sp. J2TS4 TaxID=2807194 RepID=UPI001B0E231C|nr:uroporphyrinogen-III C-methyltransferase [Paenibacillus sp. J2TS4]GIP35212.1 uroporphyrinogen III methyltransferase [Paenibacillus sp. J2TS4]